MKVQNDKKTRVMEISRPDRLMSYFERELVPFSIVTITGIVYNIGLTATPFFEGQLVQRLYDIVRGKKTIADMVFFVCLYLITILMVQTARTLKRFYVRRFANDTSRDMRHMLYNQLVHMSKKALQEETRGTLMTKAVADVDACVEGMRKFTTEIFDTGIALVSYVTMLFLYDWRLALRSCMFTPVAYVIAEKMKTVVYRYHTAYKKSAGALSDATMDRVVNGLTYRVFGRERQCDEAYEERLSDYEHKAVMANIWENMLPPIYYMISMIGVLCIIYLGGKNVLGTGWTTWDIAAFTTFLSCFGKMALKSSKAAKLFNAVQKAQVSWKRIKPLMQTYVEVNTETEVDFNRPVTVNMTHVSFAYPDNQMEQESTEKTVIKELTLQAEPGDIIGVTGPVACGKSTFGKLFLNESPYEGSITINGVELTDYTDYERNQLISYMGHQPELMSDTIQENISMGEERDVAPYIRRVCMEEEIGEMPEGMETNIGSAGTRLSGGQQDRLALARTLYHGRKIMILDDPFSAVDAKTEGLIMNHIRQMNDQGIVFIISHRISMFPEFSKVLWIEHGVCQVGTHDKLMEEQEAYAEIFRKQDVQEGTGGDLDEA